MIPPQVDMRLKSCVYIKILCLHKRYFGHEYKFTDLTSGFAGVSWSTSATPICLQLMHMHSGRPMSLCLCQHKTDHANPILQFLLHDTQVYGSSSVSASTILSDFQTPVTPWVKKIFLQFFYHVFSVKENRPFMFMLSRPPITLNAQVKPPFSYIYSKINEYIWKSLRQTAIDARSIVNIEIWNDDNKMDLCHELSEEMDPSILMFQHS